MSGSTDAAVRATFITAGGDENTKEFASAEEFIEYLETHGGDGLTDTARIGSRVDSRMTARQDPSDFLPVSGHTQVVCKDPNGNVKWREPLNWNLVTDLYRNEALKASLTSGGSTMDASNLHEGVIAGQTSNITFSTTDTISSTGIGWTESTDYSEAARPDWNAGTVAGTSVSNSTAAAFSINTSSTMGGAFLVGSSVKGNAGSSGAVGTLVAESTFSQTRNPTSGDTLEITHTIDMNT